METSSAEKKFLRAQMRARLRKLPAEERARKSADVWRQVEQHPQFAAAQVVLLYASLPDEVYSFDFIEKWRARKRILLPIVCGNDLLVGNADELRCVPSFNIAEPITPLPIVPALDVAIVPALAFDVQGNRLGRGKGFYDRFLSSHSTFKIGVCFDFQLRESIPCNERDVRMDWVVASAE